MLTVSPTPRCSHVIWLVPILLVLLLIASAPAWANVYASSFTKTGDYTFTYILNENADTNVQIQVWEVGGAQVYSEDLGPQTAGRHSWTWNGTGSSPGKSYKIKVVASDPGYTTWTKISDDNNTALCHWLPRGVVVNCNQSSTNFGQIYIGNSQGGTDHLGTDTPTGIYKVNPDGTANGWGTAGIAWDAGQHRLKVAVGPDDHLYMADVYDDYAYEISEDLQSSIQLNDHSNLSNFSNSSTQQWVRAIVVEGSQAAGNRKIYLCDSNYTSLTKGLIRYNLGSAASLPADYKGEQYIGPSYFTFYPVDFDRDADGNWYSNNYRATAGQAPFLMKFMDGTPPINTAAWEASNQYTYGNAVAINEKFGWVAGVDYNTGLVYVFNKQTGALVSSFDSGTRGDDLAFDAAGNIYVADAYDENTRIWSPPSGANSFTTESPFTMDIPGTTHSVTIIVDPTGGGTTTGAGTYESGRSVTVTATYNEGYRFSKWTDGAGAELSTSPSYTFTMPASDVVLHAVFTATSQRELKLVAVQTQGANALTGSGWYSPGTGVPVSATPNEHWHFVKWSSDLQGNNVVSTSASFTYTMPGATTTLYAHFALDTYLLNVTAYGNGTVSSNPASGSMVEYGTPVTITATADPCSYLLEWDDVANYSTMSYSPTYTFNMPAYNVDAWAIFGDRPNPFFFEGFESYVTGDLDSNQAGGPNANSSNPWFGNAPPNGYVDGTGAHSGSKGWRPKSGYTNCEDTLNLRYRTNGGYPYRENIFLDWWFYDPATATPTGFCDGVELGCYSDIPGDRDYNSQSGGNPLQRTYVGGAPTAAQSTGYDSTKYQARIMNAAGAYNTNGWFNIPGVTRARGWHHARIVVGQLDPAGNAPVSIYLDDMNAPRLTATTTIPSPISYNCIKLWGNVGAGTWGQYVDDLTFGKVPSILSVSVTPNQYVNSNTVQVSYTSVGTPSAYQLAVDDGPYSPITENPYTLDISGLSYGPHTVKIMSQDDCGVWTGPATATFTIDRSSIRSWAICGFYGCDPNVAAGSIRYGFNSFAPDGIEALVGPKTGQTYNGKSWFNYTSASPVLDLNAAYGSMQQWGNSYLGFYAINSGPDITDAYLSAGSDDGIKVWVNGNLVLGHDIYRSFGLDADISDGGAQPYTGIPAPFTLKHGWNRVLIKITQGSTNQNAQFRFCAADRSEPAWLSQLSYVLTDDVPPTGAFQINGGAATTDNAQVSLTVTLSDNESGVGYMSFSNDGVDFSPKEAFAPSKDWFLTSGTGVKTVYARLYDCAQNYIELQQSITVTNPNYTLTTVAKPTAAGTTTGDGTYPAASSVPVSATASTGYHFVKWTDDEAGTNTVSTSASFNYTMPFHDVTLYAWFEPNQYNLSVSANAGGTASSVPASGPVAYKTSVTATAIPNQCYRFVKWTDAGGNTVSTSRIYTFTMPANDVTLIANFAAENAPWFEGFETYTLNAQLDYQGPWCPDVMNGNAPPDLFIRDSSWNGVAPHSGTKMAGPYVAADNDGNAVNIKYRLNNGNDYKDGLMVDWWFYDPAGSGSNASNYKDWFALCAATGIPGNADITTSSGTGWVERIMVGSTIQYAGSTSQYQIRLIGYTTADGALNANGYFNSGRTRSVGWHHAKLVIGPQYSDTTTPVDLYIDDMKNPVFEKRSKSKMSSAGYNFIQMDGARGTANGFYDDITIDSRPQVASVTITPNAYLSANTSTIQAKFITNGTVSTYSYSIDSPTGPWTDVTSNPATIDISSLPSGTHTLYVKNGDAWACPGIEPVSNTFTVDKCSIANWAAIGFYPYGSGSPNSPGNPRFADDMFVPDGTEATMCASIGKTYNGKSWKSYSSPTAIVNFDTVWGAAQTNGDSYLFTYIINNGNAIENAYITCGSDDGIKIWVNGNVVHANDVYRGVAWCQDLSSPFTLNPGVNTLLVKETQGTGGEQAQVMLCNADKSCLTTAPGQLTYVISDDAAPTGCSASCPATTTSQTIPVTLTASDALSGMGYVQFSEDGVNYGARVAYAPVVNYTLSGGFGPKTFYVKLSDRARNEAAPIMLQTNYVNPCTPVAKISDLWAKANDATQYCLSGKTVTGVVGNAFWIEEEDRSAAIKVIWNGTMPAQDHNVDVSGALDASSGQRVLVASAVTDNGAATPIKPLFVVEKSAGGAGINADTPGITDGAGLYNVGMLVRIAGAVGNANTADPNNKYFYLDDGSGLMDGAIPGIKVLCGTVTPPSSGNKIVTGLVGVVGGKPVIVIRGSGDIQ